MTGYLDSSVLLRVLLNQAGALQEFKLLKRPISSSLLKPECLRTLDRLRVKGHLSESQYLKSCDELYDGLDSVEFVEIDQRVLERVGSSFPLPLGTLDAIHLTSALVWREHFGLRLNFLTHDEEQGKVARALGFTVLGCVEG